MEPVKRMLVSMDLTSMDELLVRYASFMARTWGVEKIIFMHAMQTYDLPQKVDEMFPDLDQPLDELIKEEMKDRIDKEFDYKAPAEVDIKVIEGHPSDKIIELAKSEDIDLTVLGKKISYSGRGILTGKVIRLAHCSVLVLPETVRFQTKKVMVPLDYSKYSRKALEQALYISDKIGAELVCQNVFSLPSYYYPYMPGERVKETMRENAEKEYEKFIKGMDRDLSNLRCEFTMDEDQDVSKKIYDFAIREQVDLIVIGSKGRTGGSTFLVGSVAEKLTHFDKSVPLLIVKDKKENLGLLEAIVKKLTG